MLFALRHMQRFRSLTEIEGSKYSRHDIRIPIFDKKTSDFCFERSREIFSKPLNFTIDLNPTTATLDKRQIDKKTRDLIGENLLDIEKTLNALNLDFIQAFNELEKTDSTETLFGDHFLFENNLKSVQTYNKKNLNDIDNIKKNKQPITKRDYYSPSLEKATSNASDKSSYSPKESTKTTPNSFSPQQESITLTRGCSFNYPIKSRNYFLSPTKRMFNNQQSFLNQMCSYDDNITSSNNMTSSGQRHRQRSMSFTDNFEIKSPSVIKASGIAKINLKSIEGRKTGSLDEEYGNRNSLLFMPPSNASNNNNSINNNSTTTTAQLMEKHQTRNVITYKPKSVRARNLRRLSYNPINMINSSSSSSSESELDKSTAHSECDIRSKNYSTSSRFQRRRQQYFHNRKSRRIIAQDGTGGYYRSENSQYSNSSNPNMINCRDGKIYGSNASIRSAPHYNYTDVKQHRFAGGGIEDKTTMSSSDLDSDDNFNSSIAERAKVSPKDTRTLTPTPQQQFASNFNNIYEFVGKCFNRNFGASSNNNNVKQQQQQPVQKAPQKPIEYQNFRRPKISNSHLDLLYTEFDISKLTGKSPTTQSYFDIIDYANMRKRSSSSTLRSSDYAKRDNAFQWPDKIDGSTVKQNDLIRQLQQQHNQDIQDKEEERRKQQQKILIENLKNPSYTTSTSETDENNSVNFRCQTNSYMPPSPAP